MEPRSCPANQSALYAVAMATEIQPLASQFGQCEYIPACCELSTPLTGSETGSESVIVFKSTQHKDSASTQRDKEPCDVCRVRVRAAV